MTAVFALSSAVKSTTRLCIVDNDSYLWFDTGCKVQDVRCLVVPTMRLQFVSAPTAATIIIL